MALRQVAFSDTEIDPRVLAALSFRATVSFVLQSLVPWFILQSTVAHSKV
jgi:hypothetical protein